MTRREDVETFYQIITDLEKVVGGKHLLAECHGRMAWPERGVYFFFEDGQLRENSKPRVVRIGTHGLKNGSKRRLWERLSQHRGTASGGGNHRGSIFRLHVGTAIMERDGLHSATWSKGRTAKNDVTSRELPIENLVSQYIGQMPFLWIEVNDPPERNSMRGYIERNSIGLLSNFGKPERIDASTQSWLGNYAWQGKIKASGLWNVKHVEDGYEPEFLDVLRKYVEEMK